MCTVRSPWMMSFDATWSCSQRTERGLITGLSWHKKVGNKMPGIRSAGAKHCHCSVFFPDIRKKCLPVCDGECFSIPPSSKKKKKGALWPKNYVGGEERGSGERDRH